MGPDEPDAPPGEELEMSEDVGAVAADELVTEELILNGNGEVAVCMAGVHGVALGRADAGKVAACAAI